MKKLFSIFILFILFTSNTYALNLQRFSSFDKDFSIPKETEIINHYLNIYKKNANTDIIWNQKNEVVKYLENKIWQTRTKQLFKNNIFHLAWNWIKREILEKDKEDINLLSLNHHIELTNNTQEDIVFNFFPVKDYKVFDDTYFQSHIRNSYIWPAGLPKVLIFDDIFLPHNIKVSFYYSNDANRTSKYINFTEKNLDVQKKYHYTKYNFWKHELMLIVPYFEITIPFSKSQTSTDSIIKDDLYISYDVIEDIYYNQYYQPIIQNSKISSMFEYKKY